MTLPNVVRLFGVALALSVAWLPGVAFAQGKTMLVFTSGVDERSTAIVDSFKASADFDATKLSFDLGMSEEEAYFVAESLQGMEASLIFAVGDIALKVAAREFRGIPIIYADARAATAAALGRTDVIEVEPRVDPGLLLERLKTLTPRLRAVGTIYSSKDRSPYWDELQAAADRAGIKLVKARVAGPYEVPNAQAGLMPEVDWLLIQRDGRLWTPATLSRMFHDSRLAGFPVVSYSNAHLESPQPPAVVMVTDANGLGQAAARMARQVITEDRGMEEVELAYPAPLVIGQKESLAQGRVLLTRRTTRAIDSWSE